jgi:hypothetical protein
LGQLSIFILPASFLTVKLTPSNQQKYVGGAGGLALGFIVGSVPGAALGAAGGAKLGMIRDAKGKSVFEVFRKSMLNLPESLTRLVDLVQNFALNQLAEELGGAQKAQLLQSLAAKLFGMVNDGARGP